MPPQAQSPGPREIRQNCPGRSLLGRPTRGEAWGEGGEGQPGPGTVWIPHGEIGPGTEVQTTEGAEKNLIGEARGDNGAEKRMGDCPQGGGVVDRCVRAKRAEAAAPDWRGGEWAPLVWGQELPTRGGCRTSE